MKIKDRIAIVTGASAGIGAATAKALARRGARVALIARGVTALESLASEIRAHGGEAGVFAADLSHAAAAHGAVERVVAQLGAPDILVHSAGAGRWLFTEETSPEEAVQMMAVPYFAAFYVTRACLPFMLARGRGHVVIVNSPAARGGWPGATGYTAARYALQGFTNALRLDLHGTGVRVTSIVPGKVDSQYFLRNTGVEARIPTVGRLIPVVTPERVADAVIHGLERDRREVIMPFMLKAFFAANHVFPQLVEWAIVRTGWQHTGRPGPAHYEAP